MGANSFGNRWVITSFGESHGHALGVVIDGCPAGIDFDEGYLKKQLERRRPGRAEVSGVSIVSARNEEDSPVVLSGVFQGKTLGTPIAIIVRNQDARSEDYKNLSPRAGHADDVWKNKFGHSDPRGGGRSSGRETVSRVMAGAVAQMFLRSVYSGFSVRGFAKQIGPIELSDDDYLALQGSKSGDFEIDQFSARFPSPQGAKQVEILLGSAITEGRSYGGLAEFWIDGVPAGLGQPVFHKLKADFAAAAMSVGATASFELGEGRASVGQEGVAFHSSNTGRYGGIRGGISTGERIVLRVGFKPTSTVLDVAKKGRHDPCIVPRAIPVLEAMFALVLADHSLWARGDK